MRKIFEVGDRVTTDMGGGKVVEVHFDESGYAYFIEYDDEPDAHYFTYYWMVVDFYDD